MAAIHGVAVEQIPVPVRLVVRMTSLLQENGNLIISIDELSALNFRGAHFFNCLYKNGAIRRIKSDRIM